MIAFLSFLFWFSVAAILYTYVVYPVLLLLLSSFHQAIKDTRFVLSKQGRRKRETELPEVTIVIAAYNEEKCIKERVENLLSLTYPADKLKILIGSDGSSDNTNSLLSAFSDPRLEAVLFEENRGKINVLNDLLSRVDTPVTVFSDANTFFQPDAINKLVADFRDDNIGGVCGELELVDAVSGDNKDSLYWQYEQILKFHESRINAMLGANGAIYAIRTALYEPLPANTIVDDFCVFMGVARQGYKVVYNPEARAIEEIAPNLKEEAGRRVRIGAGNYQTMSRLTWMLNPFIGSRCFSYVSHKVIRWFVPHFMLLALITNAVLAFGSQVYSVLMCFHALFYLAYFYGLNMSSTKQGKLAAIIRLITFFVTMNVSLGQGFIRFLTTKQSATWKRTAR